MDDIIVILRSCILTSRGGLPIDNLNRNYRELEGENIPYRKFGYTTINELLQKISDIRIYKKNGIPYVEALQTEATAHLSEMINKQRQRNRQRNGRRPTKTPPRLANRQPSYTRNNTTYGIKNNNYSYNNNNNNNNSNTNRENSQMRSNNTRSNQTHSSSRQSNVKMTNNKNSYQRVEQSQSSNRQSGNSNAPQLQRRLESCRSNNDNNNTNNTNNNRNIQRSLSSPANPNDYSSVAYTEPQKPQSSARSNELIAENPNKSVSYSPPTIPVSLLDIKLPPLPVLLQSFHIGNNNNNNNNNNYNNNNKNNTKDINDQRDSNKCNDNSQMKKSTRSINTRNSNNNYNESNAHLTKRVEPSREMSKNLIDPRTELLDLIQQLKLDEPKYNKYIRESENKKKGIYCQLSIGKNAWISYPHEARTQEEAEKIAADVALIDLYGTHLQFSNVKCTNDRELIKQRLIEIINGHKSGVFMEKMPLLYKNKYSETLPKDWISIAEACKNDLMIDNSAGTTILVLYDSAIAQHHESLLQDVTLPTIEKLILPDDTDWPIYIRTFVNVNEIWAVLIGEDYSDKDYSMSMNMMKYYKAQHEPAKTIDIDNYYVIKTDDTCHRVRVDAICTTNQVAEVFFIDYGDSEMVPFDQLFTLAKCFYKLAPQAIKFSLANLEKFTKIEIVNEIARNSLQDLSCYCRVVDKQITDNGLVISCIMYDTSGDGEVNINDMILQQISDD